MRSVVAVGAAAGLLSGIALAPLARAAGFVAVPGITLAGLVAGMGAAKWLPWGWYGRQAGAGLRAGMLATALASLGVLSGLLLAPHSYAVLARTSRLGSWSVAPIVTSLGALGWAGAIALAILAALLLGVALATGASALFGLGKSARTVQTIQRARDAAQALQRGSLRPAGQLPFALPAPQTGTAWHTTAMPSMLPPASSLTPLGGATPLATPFDPAAPAFGPATPPGAAAEPPQPVRFPRAISHNSAHPLSEAERTALARWAESADPEDADDDGGTASDEDGVDTAPGRTPPDSAYLNSATPAKRRRKPQHTRDWLC